MRAWATVVLTSADGEVASWPLSRDRAPDLSTVDALARAQLVAKRFGWSVCVRDASPELVELLELAGVELSVEVRG